MPDIVESDSPYLSKEAENVVCPFCGEADFDLVGLKSHLLKDCEMFENIEELPSLLALLFPAPTIMEVSQIPITSSQNSEKIIQNSKKKAIGHLIGTVMRETKGKSNPKKISQLIEELI